MIRLFGAFVGLFWLGSAAIAADSSDAEFSLGPLFETFPLTIGQGKRTEAAGPFFNQQDLPAQHSWAVPPLMSSVHDDVTDWHEFDVLYPLLTFDRFGTEYRFQIIQLFSFAGGNNHYAQAKDRFTLFPIYFHQRSPVSNETYTALFPIYGKLRNRLFRGEIDFFLWPLYVKTKRSPGSGTVGADEFLSAGGRWARNRRGDVTTHNFVAPIFHLRYGEGMQGWQVWPLVGHELKQVTVRTNSWGDEETIPGYEKSFVLWPIWLTDTREVGTTNTSHFKTLVPFFSSFRSPGRDSTTYLWPFGLTKTDDRIRQFRETGFLWPVFVYARGEGKTTTRFWPLFGVSHNAVMERNFYLWPLYKHSHIQSEPLDRSRTQILLFLYSDVRQKNTITLQDSRRVDCWPLFTHTRDADGNTRLQVLSIIEPILSKSKSVDRTYTPLWSLWRAENNPVSGASSQSLLWNLYRHQQSAAGERKTSFLFGLFQHRSTPTGSALRLFYVPLKKLPHKESAAAIDSSDLLKQPSSGNHP